MELAKIIAAYRINHWPMFMQNLQNLEKNKTIFSMWQYKISIKSQKEAKFSVIGAQCVCSAELAHLSQIQSNADTLYSINIVKVLDNNQSPKVWLKLPVSSERKFASFSQTG